MYDPEMRKDCPMRGNLGNCSPVGGFCMDAVSDEICEAVHNAYYHGFRNAVKTLKEQEKENKALRLLIEWATDCNFGFDKFPDEYERYKDEIKDMEYIDGMIHIAKRTLEEGW